MMTSYLARTTSTRLSALLVCAALGASAAPHTAWAQPAPQSVQMATAAFQEGKKNFEAGKFAQSLDQFKRSYDLVASPNSHIYIARCLDKTGNQKEAFRTFQAVVVEADMRSKTEAKYGPTRDSAKQELAELAARIGVVNIAVHSTDPGAHVKMNGGIIPKEDWGKDIPEDPGPADFTLEVPGQATATVHVTIPKGQKTTVDLSPPTANVAPPPIQPVAHGGGKGPFLPIAIAFTGVGVVGAAMFIGGAVTSKSTFNELNDHKCTSPCTVPNDVSKGKTQQLIANIGIGVGAVGLAAGATFFIVAATSKGKSDEHASTEGPSVSVDLSPTYAGLHGAF